MSLFENFPFTNLHQLNLNWLIEEVKKCYSPDNPPEAMVISVNGESGVVTLYKDAHVALPDITEEQWNLYRGSANKITGIEFNKDAAATRINGNQRFLIYDAGNPPPYPVIAVNGETGNVILYKEPYAVFPDVEGDNWGLERKLNTNTTDETRVGIMFDDTGKAYITHDEDSTQILTREDIPSSSGVAVVNGKTGVVELTGEDININTTSQTTIAQQENAQDTNINNLENFIGKTALIVSSATHRAIDSNEIIYLLNYPSITNGFYRVNSDIAENVDITANNINPLVNTVFNDFIRVERRNVSLDTNGIGAIGWPQNVNREGCILVAAFPNSWNETTVIFTNSAYAQIKCPGLAAQTVLFNLVWICPVWEAIQT